MDLSRAGGHTGIKRRRQRRAAAAPPAALKLQGGVAAPFGVVWGREGGGQGVEGDE